MPIKSCSQAQPPNGNSQLTWTNFMGTFVVEFCTDVLQSEIIIQILCWFWLDWIDQNRTKKFIFCNSSLAQRIKQLNEENWGGGGGRAFCRPPWRASSLRVSSHCRDESKSSSVFPPLKCLTASTMTGKLVSLVWLEKLRKLGHFLS